MKVKTLIPFWDVQANCDRKEGEVFTVTAARAKKLMDTSFGKLVEEVEKPKTKNADKE